MTIIHQQVGTVHFFFHECTGQEGCEHKIVIKTPKYKHTIVHGEANLRDAKIHAIDVAVKTGLISVEEAAEALANL